MSNLMSAARLHRIGEKLTIDRVPIRSVGANDVLVDIKASGICHSDLNYRDGVSGVGKLPIILGHEIAGTIAAVGTHVKGLDKGDRVCIDYLSTCKDCKFCRADRENLCEKYQMIGKDIDGGFAEYLTLPAKNVLQLPKSLPFEQGAIVGCSVVTAYHALRRGRVTAGENVLIYGIGGVGIHAVQLAAKIFKVKKIIAVDISDKKLELAKKLGATEVVNASKQNPIERIKELTNGRFSDVALDFIGLRKTIETAIECVGKGGKMVMVGIGPEDITVSPYKTVIGKEIELIGANDHLNFEIAQLITFVSSKKLDLSNSITHRVSLKDVNYGLEILEKKIGNPIKVVAVQ